MLKFDSKGLIPVIVQDAADGTVLMLGYATRESLKLTLDSGEMWFYSRSRQELWHKGSTSGNVLRVKSISVDCDSDALLVQANPAGPTCHTGNRSCFFTGFARADLG
jgi:phosphoribosyl-AMP cyclohydrolase